jgi:hypothetical protein
MFRTGIYLLRQLNDSNIYDVFRNEKNISLLLYENLENEQDAELRDKYREIILNRFISHECIFKRTYRNRFNTFDDLSISTIIDQGFSDLRIHDTAVSDGRASCYFLENVLKKLNITAYHATDQALVYYMYKPQVSSKSYMITDSNHHICEITLAPFVWNYARSESMFYFFNNILKTLIKYYYQYLFKKGSMLGIKTVFIIDDEFRKLIDENKKLKLFDHNLFNRTTGIYEVIRAMNILNNEYFTNQQLNRILTNLFQSLINGGLFIEGSNEEAGTPVEGAIYRKKNKGFELITLGDRPSRILHQVLQFDIDKFNETLEDQPKQSIEYYY